MATLTKAELIERLNSEIGLNKREAKDLVDIFFEQISAVLKAGTQVKLAGFGNFNVLDKRERPGRNPKTGEETAVSARRSVSFHAGKKLKARVENYVSKLS